MLQLFHKKNTNTNPTPSLLSLTLSLCLSLSLSLSLSNAIYRRKSPNQEHSWPNLNPTRPMFHSNQHTKEAHPALRISCAIRRSRLKLRPGCRRAGLLGSATPPDRGSSAPRACRLPIGRWDVAPKDPDLQEGRKHCTQCGWSIWPPFFF